MTQAREEDLDRAGATAARLQQIADLERRLAAADALAAGMDGANEMVQHLIDQNIIEMDAARNIQVNPNMVIQPRPSES